ncbi:MAG: ubiquitin-conjugating enzyme E2 variant [Candidatus Hodarchaeales archaeon]|jgi:ubiquitin-protein ligase
MNQGDQELLLAREVQLIYSNVQGFFMVDGSLRTWRGTIKVGRPIPEDFEFEIFIPQLFPEAPPVVRAITPINHAHVDKDGFIRLQILNRWRREFHVYQVMLQLISLMKRDPPVKAKFEKFPYQKEANYEISSTKSYAKATQQPTRYIPSSSNRSPSSVHSPQPSPTQQEMQERALLKKQVDHLKDEVTKRDEELTRFRAREAIGISDSDQSSKRSFQTSFKHLDPNDQIAEFESEQIAISEMMTSLHEKYTMGDVSIFDYSKLYKKYSRDLYILSKKLEYVKSKQ